MPKIEYLTNITCYIFLKSGELLSSCPHARHCESV